MPWQLIQTGGPFLAPRLAAPYQQTLDAPFTPPSLPLHPPWPPCRAVANMFLIPMGMVLGEGQVSIHAFIFQHLRPVTVRFAVSLEGMGLSFNPLDSEAFRR